MELTINNDSMANLEIKGKVRSVLKGACCDVSPFGSASVPSWALTKVLNGSWSRLAVIADGSEVLRITSGDIQEYEELTVSTSHDAFSHRVARA